MTFDFQMSGTEGELEVRTSGLAITDCIGEALAIYEMEFDTDPLSLSCHFVAP